MGCDIHLYVEYKPRNETRNYWFDFGRRFYLARNYFLFGLMAKGVRYEDKNSFEIRGLPKNLGFASKDDNELYLTESGGEGCAMPSEAEKWVKQGSSKYIDNDKGDHISVTHPDWHSHSWLTKDEFAKVMKIYNEHPETSVNPEYEAVLAVLNKFEELNYDTRIVFWFDN